MTTTTGATQGGSHDLARSNQGGTVRNSVHGVADLASAGNRSGAVDDYTPLDELANDPATIASMEHDVICTAVDRAAAELVTFSAFDVRCRMEREVNPHRVGAVISGLVKSGALVKTGKWAESRNAKSRNTHRPMPVYRARRTATPS